MAVGLVLDPTVPVALPDELAPGAPPVVARRYDLGSLDGARVAIRGDELWRSWDWVVDEWTPRLEAQGASVTFWRSAGNRVGKHADQALDELHELLDGADLIISGLGTCGSCTMWTTHDALAGADRDLPAVAVVTAHFDGLAHTFTSRGGHPDLPVQVLPYPLETRSEAEVRAIAADRFDDVLQTLGVR